MAYPEDSNPSTIELDLSNTPGISTIKIDLFNNCGADCTVIQTLNTTNIIQELNNNTTIPTGRSTVRIENISIAITALKKA